MPRSFELSRGAGQASISEAGRAASPPRVCPPPELPRIPHRPTRMFIVADVIFPAFFMPYMLAMLFPIAGIALLATELAVYRCWFRELTWGRIVAMVLSSNLLSSILGVAAAAAMPSGLKQNWHATQGDIHEKVWNTYATSSWVLAWAVSVVVEYFFIRWVFRRDRLPRLLPCVVVANTASYIALLVIAIGAAHC